MREVEVVARSLDAFAPPLVRPSHLARFETALRAAAERLTGQTLWHVNSTSEGGGVAELLHGLLGYLVAGRIRTRWLVIEGRPEFFRVTKRLHNQLHGSPGDGAPLGEEERHVYRHTLDENLELILGRVAPGDVAVLHDPQTAGLVRPLRDAGVDVVWVCHVGVDRPNDAVRSAWDFLRSDVLAADALVFSRRTYVWEGLDRRKTRVIPPCIDPASPKNIELSASERTAILQAAGLLAAPERAETLVDPSGLGAIRVLRRAEMVEEDPVPTDAPLVVQVSRWDRLKDHLGVLHGFARHVPLDLEAHLLLAGPAAVPDDPEGSVVLTELIEAWGRLPAAVRGRVHLAILSLQDLIENAVIVNALQGRADVVVQKSIAEGFGLTVAEAMWKRRPVVGSRVGGIQDQIVDGRSGLLVGARDLPALGEAVSSLIRDPGFAGAIGHAARARVRLRFLPPHFLASHLELIEKLLVTK